MKSGILKKIDAICIFINEIISDNTLLFYLTVYDIPSLLRIEEELEALSDRSINSN